MENVNLAFIAVRILPNLIKNAIIQMYMAEILNFFGDNILALFDNTHSFQRNFTAY